MSSRTVSALAPEETKVQKSPSTALPVKLDLKLAYLFSLVIALLTGIASIADLLYPSNIYPTAELRESFLANDVVNLFIGLPILLGSMWLARRGHLIGLLFWPGALFYGLYNYLIYLFGMPFNVMFPLYLAIVTLSVYLTIGLVASVKGDAAKQQLNGRVPARFAGGVLIGFGILFVLRVMVVMLGSLTSQTPIARPELALLVADFIISLAFVIGGVLLWQRRPLGYVGGTGLLFQASMLFIGLIAILILQPVLTGAAFAVADVVVVFAMGSICFIPFVLFVRGAVKS